MSYRVMPIGKPKIGYEKEFNDLIFKIKNYENLSVSFVDKIIGRKKPEKKELIKHWKSIQNSPYETIRTPRVGRDQRANQHVIDVIYEGELKPEHHDQVIKNYDGFYFGELAEIQDGISVYSDGGGDVIAFNAGYLIESEPLVSNGLLGGSWGLKLSNETKEYGLRVKAEAAHLANKHGIEYLEGQRVRPNSAIESIESKVHVLFEFSRWLIFWGENGHGIEGGY